jgi:inorganic pyrophosphatase
MDISKIPIGRNPPIDLNAVIEIPIGGVPVKYELDKASGAMFVDRFLHTAMFYPGNYGFIPHTLSEDGDPCDILVVTNVAVVPGAVIRCRPGCRMRQAWMRKSSQCRSTTFIRSIPMFATTRTCHPY